MTLSKTKVCISLFLTLGMCFFASVVEAQTQPFIEVDESYYSDHHTNGVVDLTDRLPIVRPLENILPRDTGSWNVRTFDCSGSETASAANYLAELNDAIANPDVNGDVIQFPADCQISYGGTSGNWASIPSTADNIVTRGNADGLSAIYYLLDDDLCGNDSGSRNICDSASGNSGTDREGFRIDANNNNKNVMSYVDQWDWTGGFARGSNLVQSDGSSGNQITEIYADDIVQLTIPSWGFSGSGANPDWSDMYRVVCAKWHNETTQGTGCDLDPANSIRLDRVHNFVMDGSTFTDYESAAPFATGSINHVERYGGSNPDTNNIPVNIGFENLTIGMHPNGEIHVREGSVNFIRFNNCFECWVVDSTFDDEGGPSVMEIHGNSILIKNNVFSGFVNESVCIARVTDVHSSVCEVDGTTICDEDSDCSSGACGSIEVTISSDSIANLEGGGRKCDSIPTNQNLFPYVSFSLDFAESSDPVIAGMANGLYVYDCNPASGNGDCSRGGADETVRWGLTDFRLDAPVRGIVDDSDLPTNAYMKLGRVYSVAKFYRASGAGSHFINNFFIDSRIGVIFQSGVQNDVFFGNVFRRSSNSEPCNRSWFIHGGRASHLLFEANDSDCGFVLVAGAEVNGPEGPGTTYYRNRHVWGGAETHAGNGQNCSAETAGICNEGYDAQGFANYDWSILNNFVGGTTSGAGQLGWCDNTDGGGCAAPYAWTDMEVHGNVFHSQNVISGQHYETTNDNPTFNAPDMLAGLNDNVDVQPSAWNSRVYPTSIYLDSFMQEPDWWCLESGTIPAGTFPGIGADFDDLSTWPSSYNKLPAERVYDGDPCTPVSNLPGSASFNSTKTQVVAGTLIEAVVSWESTAPTTLCNACVGNPCVNSNSVFSTNEQSSGSAFILGSNLVANATTTIGVNCHDPLDPSNVKTDFVSIKAVEPPTQTLTVTGPGATPQTPIGSGGTTTLSWTSTFDSDDTEDLTAPSLTSKCVSYELLYACDSSIVPNIWCVTGFDDEICQGGSNDGQVCTPSTCTGGNFAGTACEDNSECRLTEVLCVGGFCDGGSEDGNVCNIASDCTDVSTCDDGDNDCPSGTCDIFAIEGTNITTPALTQNSTFGMRCQTEDGSAEQTSFVGVYVSDEPAPVINTFRMSVVSDGDSPTFKALSGDGAYTNVGRGMRATWNVSGDGVTCSGTNFTISGGAAQGSVGGFTISGPTTYTLTCTGTGGVVAAQSITINTFATPTNLSLAASPSSIVVGGSSNLVWSGDNITHCYPGSVGVTNQIFASPNSWTQTTSGASSGSVLIPAQWRNTTGTRYFSMYCYNSLNPDLLWNLPSGNATLTVVSSPNPGDFTASPTAVSAPGDNVTLSWGASPASATGCSAFGDSSGEWTGAKGTAGGSEVVTPDIDTTYRLTCTSSTGATDNEFATVSVPETVDIRDPVPTHIPVSGSPTYSSGDITNLASLTVEDVDLDELEVHRYFFRNNGGTLQTVRSNGGTPEWTNCVIGAAGNGCQTALFDITTGDATGASLAIDTDAESGSASGAEVWLRKCASSTCTYQNGSDAVPSGGTIPLINTSSAGNSFNAATMLGEGVPYFYLEIRQAPSSGTIVVITVTDIAD